MQCTPVMELFITMGEKSHQFFQVYRISLPSQFYDHYSFFAVEFLKNPVEIQNEKHFLQLFKYIHIWVFSGTFCHDRVIVYHKMFHHEFSSLSNFVLQIVAFFRCMLYYHFSLAYSSFVSESCKIIDGYRPNTTETAGQIFATPRIFTDRSVTLNPF